MSSAALWLGFRRFRTVDLSIASIICLVWSITISVYTAKSWSSCDVGQRGFLLGLIVLDFFSAILIYLMIVVKYTFWPDVARTGVLLGLHSTGVMIFTMYTPHFPCVAFGSAAHCHTFMIGVLAGLWTVTSLLLAYGICLPFMAVIPSPPNIKKTEGDLEGRPVSIVKGQKKEEEVIGEERRKSRASAGSRAWLLGNQKGTSPELALSGRPAPPRYSGAPRHHSLYASSSLSSFNSAPPRYPLGRQIKFENPRGPSHPPVCWTVAHPIRAPYTSAAQRSLSVSRSSLESPSSHSTYYSSSLRSLPLPNHLGGKGTNLNGNRVSAVPYSRHTSAHTEYEYPAVLVTLPAVNESTSSLSVYSQSSAQCSSIASTGAPLSTIGPNELRSLPSRPPIGKQHWPYFAPRSPDQDYVRYMRASVHGYPDQGMNFCSPTGGFPSPHVTALPTSNFSASSGLTSFGLYPRAQSANVGGFYEIVADTPHYYLPWQDSNATIVSAATARSPHFRNDSTPSHVNMHEWRKLVLDAARKR